MAEPLVAVRPPRPPVWLRRRMGIPPALPPPGWTPPPRHDQVS
ncbi:hypothetical protein [Geodermatophilus normandii]|nr:hypothetical protein [Geodermatophilus normandii]